MNKSFFVSLLLFLLINSNIYPTFSEKLTAWARFLFLDDDEAFDKQKREEEKKKKKEQEDSEKKHKSGVDEQLEGIKEILKNSPPGTINNFNIQSNQENQHVNFTIFGFDFLNPEHYRSLYEKTKNNAQIGYSNLINWIQNNKKKATFYSLSIIYLLIEAKLFYLVYLLNHPNLWSNWNENKTLEELYQIPQTRFSKTLLSDIQQQYTVLNNPTDFVTPLTKFMHDIDFELKMLNQYLYITSLLETCYVKKLFWFDKKLLKKAPDRVKRLNYIKHTFLGWLADYKLNQTQKNNLNNLNF